MNTDNIYSLCAANSIRWTEHAIKRLIQRNISRSEVKHVLSNGEIIEEYPDDYPYPSCLVLGITQNKRYLHVVCGIGDGELWVISAYQPAAEKWVDEFSKRKEI